MISMVCCGCRANSKVPNDPGDVTMQKKRKAKDQLCYTMNSTCSTRRRLVELAVLQLQRPQNSRTMGAGQLYTHRREQGTKSTKTRSERSGEVCKCLHGPLMLSHSAQAAEVSQTRLCWMDPEGHRQHNDSKVPTQSGYILLRGRLVFWTSEIGPTLSARLREGEAPWKSCLRAEPR